MPLRFVANKIRQKFSKFDELGKILGGEIGSYERGGLLLTYPLTLRSEVDRPVIRFTSYESAKNPSFVFLPCPAGISFSEGAQFNTVNIGSLGVGLGAAAEVLESAAAEMNRTEGDVQAKILAGIESLKKNPLPGLEALTGNMDSQDLLTIALQYVPGFEALKALRGRKAGSIVAPNAVQTFGGNNIRQFNFSFKMVAKSRTEAKEIDKIHRHFRRSIYGDAGGTNSNQNFTLKYPPVFNIDFLDMARGGTPNQYLPKIYSCFLQGFTSTFNPSVDMFHRDGTPIEVDVSLDFIESRELHRGDIRELEKEGGARINRASYTGVDEDTNLLDSDILKDFVQNEVRDKIAEVGDQIR